MSKMVVMRCWQSVREGREDEEAGTVQVGWVGGLGLAARA